MSALTKQEGGNHYKTLNIQPIEYITKNNLDYLSGNVIKYVTRHKYKDGAQDIKKAIHYLELILELEYTEQQSPPSIVIQAQGFHADVFGAVGEQDVIYELLPNNYPTWQEIEALPAFQMFKKECFLDKNLSLPTANLDLIEQYQTWHKEKGLWYKETPFGQLLED